MINPRIYAFNEFKDLAVFLYERMLTKQQGDELDYLMPFVVNGSLACELGLKALLSLQGIDHGKKHLLAELFDKNQESVRRAIVEGMPSLLDKSVDSPEFRKWLGVISDNFRKWRYWYEDNLETK